MTVSLRRQWQHFKATPSGQRFETRHRSRRASSSGIARKIVISTLGVLIILAGIAMLVLPGPGIIALIGGAALIAEESLIAARILDRFDVWTTHVYRNWRTRRAR